MPTRSKRLMYQLSSMRAQRIPLRSTASCTLPLKRHVFLRTLRDPVDSITDKARTLRANDSPKTNYDPQGAGGPTQTLNPGCPVLAPLGRDGCSRMSMSRPPRRKDWETRPYTRIPSLRRASRASRRITAAPLSIAPSCRLRRPAQRFVLASSRSRSASAASRQVARSSQ